MIRLSNINKTYHSGKIDTPVLHDFSLDINDGDFVAVMGPSGSGKSTILNIIGMMDDADSGQYMLDDVNVSELKKKKKEKLRREKIAFVFQNFALMNKCSVYENVELPLVSRKHSVRKRKATVREVLNKLGIGELEKKRVCDISQGQQQRVSIARALVSDADYLLADEPTGNLDSATTIDIMELLKSINEEGKTIIVVTHDKNVAAYAKRIVEIS